MLSALVLVLSAFCISEALAYPRRAHWSGLRNRMDNVTRAASSYDVERTNNWSGGVLSGPQGTFNSVNGTFTVPIPQGSTDSVASAWVGIDGSTCSQAILQTGIVMQPDGNGGGVYTAWYEWYPDLAEYFDLAVDAGDIVTLTVVAYSANNGLAIIDNVSQGYSEQAVLTSQHALCMQDAEWIVEDPMDANGNLLPFANFGIVQFNDAKATGPAGTYTPEGAIVSVMLTPNRKDMQTSVMISEDSITVAYKDG